MLLAYRCWAPFSDTRANKSVRAGQLTKRCLLCIYDERWLLTRPGGLALAMARAWCGWRGQQQQSAARSPLSAVYCHAVQVKQHSWMPSIWNWNRAWFQNWWNSYKLHLPAAKSSSSWRYNNHATIWKAAIWILNRIEEHRCISASFTSWLWHCEYKLWLNANYALSQCRRFFLAQAFAVTRFTIFCLILFADTNFGFLQTTKD